MKALNKKQEIEPEIGSWWHQAEKLRFWTPRPPQLQLQHPQWLYAWLAVVVVLVLVPVPRAIFGTPSHPLLSGFLMILPATEAASCFSSRCILRVRDRFPSRCNSARARTQWFGQTSRRP
jgi:hypothetical protein